MPRYAKQNDSVSCGPTAILNAMKWADLDVTTRAHLPFLQFGCRTFDLEDPKDYDASGTTDWDFDRVLRYVAKGNFIVHRKKQPSLQSVKKHLESGGAICLSYHWEEKGQIGDHFCFLSGIKRGLIETVNDHNAINEETVCLRSPTTLKRWLKKGRLDDNPNSKNDYPYAWFLSKE